ncbi:MAG: peptide-methionine (S)-S-oxide reductase [Candidatus Saccharibacteria bacterium]|nr:peptide-methionine (S)-S-oxide reductase [Candidatus Saccharibacteria bacterium]
MNEVATLAGGCYWCLEAFYQRVRGISEVVSGYTGGQLKNPTTEQVYAGGTGHAEAVEVTYDPSIISYKEILEIFFVMHDPTQLNRQGPDIGEHYRSAIFYHDAGQKVIAEDMISNFAPELYDKPIVTQLNPYIVLWPADEYMQNFYNNNPSSGYCLAVIDPKIQKLRQKFAEKLI